METAPDLSTEQVYAQLQANVEANPIIFGAAMAFDPETVESDDLYCPFVWRGVEGIERMNIGRDDVDWFGEEQWQWWHRVRESGEAVWTDPYFDEGAGETR